jgi:hypothetical protein
MVPVSAPAPPEAKLITERMDELGLSARAAALTAGISPTLMLEIRKGQRRASPRTMGKIARMLWWSPEDLEEMGRADAVDQLRRELNAGPREATIAEIRDVVARLGAINGLTEGQQRLIAEQFLRVLERESSN